MTSTKNKAAYSLLLMQLGCHVVAGHYLEVFDPFVFAQYLQHEVVCACSYN